MLIEKISIDKFRGFKNAQFNLGTSLTVIAGQNGTQKTTLLGMLSQPFSITDKTHPLYGEKPLCGGSFRSAFAEKFKLSELFDQAKSHEWTLHFNEGESFTIESIKRDPKKPDIRFWKKGTRSKGSGYVQKPVIYLSLSRLFPIGEDEELNTSNDVELTSDEFQFYKSWHNKILCIPDVEMTGANYLASKQKNTLGANTKFYDWKMNSAGQDTIGKILLAILSFKRLKEKSFDYSGGIFAIDELDATLYPASQIQLVKALRRFSSNLNLQIIFTTHSLCILEEACSLSEDTSLKNQVNVIYLEKIDNKIIPQENLSYDSIFRRLNVVAGKATAIKKILTYFEDAEAAIFFKGLLKQGRGKKLKYVNTTLGCNNLIGLSKQKIYAFSFPISLICLDGDVSNNKIKSLKNFLLLPGKDSPERIFAKFLFQLNDSDPLWEEMAQDYTKQVVFRDIIFDEIKQDRNKAKQWFQSQKQYWGRGCSKLINAWSKKNKEEVDSFLKNFDDKIREYEKFLGCQLG